MTNYRKYLYPFAAVLLSIALAACAGTREMTDFSIVGEAPGFEDNVLTLAEGESNLLGGRAHFDNETTDSVIGALINWSSSDEDEEYVSIANTGRVTAVSSTTLLPVPVEITGRYNGFEDKITVDVEPSGL